MTKSTTQSRDLMGQPAAADMARLVQTRQDGACCKQSLCMTTVQLCYTLYMTLSFFAGWVEEWLGLAESRVL